MPDNILQNFDKILVFFVTKFLAIKMESESLHCKWNHKVDDSLINAQKYPCTASNLVLRIQVNIQNTAVLIPI